MLKADEAQQLSLGSLGVFKCTHGYTLVSKAPSMTISIFPV